MEENANNLDIILQDCLEKIRNGEETLDSALALYPQIAADLRPLLEAGLWIQSRQDILQPRPGFVSSSRRRLVEEIQKEQSPELAVGNVSWWENFLQHLSSDFQQKRLAARLVTALVLVLALLLTAGGTGIAKASQSALPGDRLYSVKRTIEKAELALTPDEAGKAEIYIKYAQRRLVEAQSLLEKNRTEKFAETVSLFEDQVYNAIGYMVVISDHDHKKAMELAGELNSTLQEESKVLRHLAASAPPEVSSEIDRLLSVSDGMIILIGNRLPIVAATATIAPTSTSTPGIAIVIPPEASPTALITPSPTPRHVVVIPTLHESIPTLTGTATITSTVSADTKEKKPTHTPKKTDKPTKTPKPEKTKKPHPKPNK